MKNILSLLLLILTLPNCFKKKPSSSLILNKNSYASADNCSIDPLGSQSIDVNYSDSLLAEELDAFVLEQEENPFDYEYEDNSLENNKNNIQFIESEEVDTPGDIYSDSAQYGLKTIFYNFNQYHPRTDQSPILEHNLEKVKELANNNYSIVLEGHACDSAGTPEYNVLLSEKRAQEVYNYFVKNGVNKSCLSTLGRGAEYRIVPEGNREQQAPNRRVEIFAYKN